MVAAIAFAVDTQDDDEEVVVPPPAGEVTIVFAQPQGSKRLWQTHNADMQCAVQVMVSHMRQLLVAHSGYEVKMEMDTFLCAFQNPVDALHWAVQLQAELPTLPWPKGVTEDGEVSHLSPVTQVSTQLPAHA